jgi:hypothetical protein
MKYVSVSDTAAIALITRLESQAKKEKTLRTLIKEGAISSKKAKKIARAIVVREG